MCCFGDHLRNSSLDEPEDDSEEGWGRGVEYKIWAFCSEGQIV